MARVIASLFLLLLIVSIHSCTKRPYACFRTIPEEDSLKVNVPITFIASCSSNGDDFFWEFYDNPDSSEFGYSTVRTFHTAGQVEVFLLVAGNGKTAATTKMVTINP